MSRAAALLALPLAASLTGASPPKIVLPHDGTTVTVTVTDLRNARGLVRACMTADPQRFPKCRGDTASYRAVVDARSGRMVLTFDDVAPGRYAVALLHDENGNGKADRALGMMPTEGFGFSRDAKVQMGPPAFEAAALDVTGTPKSVAIRMRYML